MADAQERRRTPRKAATKATPTPDSKPTKAKAVVKGKPDVKAAAPRRATAEQRAAPVTTSNVRAELSPEEIRELIAEAAYYRAEQRGFEPGHELEDWIEAESEIIGRLNSSR